MENNPQIVPIKSAVADLEILMDQLADKRDREFADSLINGQYGWKKRGFLTEKQAPHVYRLLAKAMGVGPADGSKSVSIGLMQNIYSLFEKAKKHVKFPKVKLHLGIEGHVEIWVQGDKAKVPGGVGVKVGNANMHTGFWAGRILQNGEFMPSKDFGQLQSKDDVIDLLKAFAQNPAEVAAKHGHLSGNCAFCQLPLTDPKSLAVGYGPTCAKNYGLPWGDAELKLPDSPADWAYHPDIE